MPKPCPVEEFHQHGIRILEAIEKHSMGERYDGLENIKIALCGPYGRILRDLNSPAVPLAQSAQVYHSTGDSGKYPACYHHRK
jgi:hypothetical protein